MTDTSSSFAALNPRSRMACTAAAALCAAGINLGLLSLFDQASSERWLTPTAQVLQAQAQCDSMASRSARQRCTQALVARAQAPGLRTAQARP